MAILAEKEANKRETYLAFEAPRTKVDRVMLTFGVQSALKTCPQPSPLQIQITERPAQRTHHIPNGSRLSSITHINNIIERSLPRRRLVCPRHMAVLTTIHLVFLESTAAEVEQLPVLRVMVRDMRFLMTGLEDMG